MNNFADYYNQKKKDYQYKVKVALCDFSEDQKECIEASLQKYDISGKITYKKTPIQESPLDFPSLSNVEVHIAEITLQYPASPETLRQYLADASGINLSCIAVYTLNDPRLQDQEDYLHRKTPEFKDGYVPALGSDYEADDNSHLYGDKRNMELLKDLEKARKARPDNTVINALSQKQKTDGSTAAGNETGAQGTNTPLTKVDIERFTPNKKVTLFSKNKD